MAPRCKDLEQFFKANAKIGGGKVIKDTKKQQELEKTISKRNEEIKALKNAAKP